MHLSNFDLSSQAFSIELIGLDFIWDLHNVGEFLGLRLQPDDNSAIMSWRISSHPSNKFSGCQLVFKNLRMLIITPRDEGLPRTEDLCVAGISRVIPNGGDKPEHRIRQSVPDDHFNLLFQFQSGRSIEIDAETVELVGIMK